MEMSQESEQCYDALKELEVKRVFREFSLRSLPNRRFDFKFTHNGKRYILEYDGKQHFEFPNVYHNTKREFNEYRRTDIEKSIAAIREGYILIRIAYSDLNNITDILQRVFNSNGTCYFSNPTSYSYIGDNL